MNRRFVLVMMLVFAGAAALQAQDSWERMNGPYGGTVNGVLARPSDGAVFAGTYPSYVYRTTDHGAHWMQVKQGMNNTGTFCFAVDSNGAVYAGGFGGIYRSTDSGDNWTWTGVPSYYTHALAVDQSQNVYGGTSNGIVRSTDGGYTFAGSGLAGKTVYALVCNGAGELFAGTSADGVYRSTDQGTSWVQSNSGMLGTGVSAIAVQPVTDHLLLASDQLYISTDAGVNWTPIPGAPAYINGLLIQPVTRYYLAATGNGIFRSTDFGTNWTLVTGGLAISSFTNLTVDEQGRLYASSQGGVFRSTDNGANWHDINDGLTNTSVRVLARNNHDTLFAGTSTAGLYRSGDLGLTWRSLAQPGINTFVGGVGVLNPAIALSTIIMGTGRGLYLSTNNGDTWTELTSGLPASAYYHCVFAPPSGYVYVGTHQAGMFRSTDGGATWERLTNGLTDSTFLSFATNPQTGELMAGSMTQGVFHSADFGDNWTQRNTGIDDELNVNTLAYTPGLGIWYAGTGSDSLYRSTDAGANWTDVSHGQFHNQVYGVITKGDGEVFVGYNDGVAISPDTCHTWNNFSSGLTWSAVRSIMMGNSSPFLWAGTDGWGVYRTTHYVPVELQAFTARRAGEGVELRWRTASERNTHLFLVERRIDGAAEGGWTPLSTLLAKGGGGGGAEYASLDASLPASSPASYRLRILDNDGSVSWSPVVDVPADGQAMPIALGQNFPNPVRNSGAAGSNTSIAFTLDEPRFVTLRLYDALGREAGMLLEGNVPAGTRTVDLNAAGLVPGAYYYRLTAGGFALMRRLVVIE